MDQIIPTFPIYELVIDEDIDESTGVQIVSLVKSPAIEKNFMIFSEEKPKLYRFQVDNQMKRIVSGPIMIPDTPIYRETAGQSYFVYFSKETIYEIVQKYAKTKSIANVNVEHSGPLINGVYQFESFIIDETRGINPPNGYGDLPQGTWFGSWKVDNDEIFAQILSGELQGFSVEGFFDYVIPAPTSLPTSTEELLQALENLINLLE